MIFKNYEIVLFSGDFVNLITPLITVFAVFLTYYLAKKEFKFKNYYERKVEVLCDIYGILEELKFLIRKTVLNSDEDLMIDNLKKCGDMYQDFNVLKRKKSIFFDENLFKDIKNFEDEWLQIYAKIMGAYREKKTTSNKGWGNQYDDALNKIVSENLEKILEKINITVKKELRS